MWVPGLEKVIYSRYNKYRQRNEGVSSVKDGTPLFITDIIQGVLTMRNNLIKVAAAVPELKIGDITYNTEKIIEVIDEHSDIGLIVFPELSLKLWLEDLK